MSNLISHILSGDADKRQLEAVRYALDAEGRKADAWGSVLKSIEVPQRRSRKTFLRVAAVLLPLAISMLMIVFFRPPSPQSTYATAATVDTVRLPDGSIALLADGSSLTYAENWRGRFATLTGTAVFKVQKDPKHPFRVKAKDVEVRVLGTTFRVENRPNQNFIRTVVEEGRVKMSAKRSDVILTAGEEATWQDGKLVSSMTAHQHNLFENPIRRRYEGASLHHIAEDVAMTFHTQITSIDCDETADSILLTTTFETETLDEIVNELALLSGKKIAIVNGCLTITD